MRFRDRILNMALNSDDLVLSVRLFEQKMTPDYCRRYIIHLKVVLKAIIEKNGNWSDH